MPLRWSKSHARASPCKKISALASSTSFWLASWHFSSSSRKAARNVPEIGCAARSFTCTNDPGSMTDRNSCDGRETTSPFENINAVQPNIPLAGARYCLDMGLATRYWPDLSQCRRGPLRCWRSAIPSLWPVIPLPYRPFYGEARRGATGCPATRLATCASTNGPQCSCHLNHQVT